MKLWILGLVALSTVHANAANWKEIVGTFRTGTGTQLVVPLPAEARFTQFGYTVVPAYATQFYVRVEPAAACRLATLDNGELVGTGVLSSQFGLQPTSFVREERSRRPGRDGWTNSYFSVNAGAGAAVQAITVVFRRGGAAARQCDFEIAYTGDDMNVPAAELAAAGTGARALAAPAAAPAAARNLGEVQIKVETKHQ